MNTATIHSCWLTLNRDCNLRCRWCYAKGTGYKKTSNMPEETAFRLLDMAGELGIRHVSLIGGEPTVYEPLGRVVVHATSLGIACGLITNGVRLSDPAYLEALRSDGLSAVGLSLKGYSPENFARITGVRKYHDALQGIRHLSDTEIPYSVSMVLDSENIGCFLPGVRDAVKAGAERFYFSFEFDFDFSSSSTENDTDFDFEKHVFRLIDGFCACYEELCALTEGKFILHQTFPLCVWDQNILMAMKSRYQIQTSCQLLQRSGLVFDTNGDILLCNAMYDYPVGHLDVDFSNGEELKQFLAQDQIGEIYDRLAAVPSKRCLDCPQWSFCGGGCVSNWSHYDLETLLARFQERQRG